MTLSRPRVPTIKRDTNYNDIKSTHLAEGCWLEEDFSNDVIDIIWLRE